MHRPGPTPVVLAVLVALLTAAVHLPALSCGFVNWDDPNVLLDNLQIRKLDLESLRWMLTSFHTSNWIPLTWLSHALVYQAAGLDPRAHHLVNVLLHALNAAAVFGVARLVLARARERGAASLDPGRSNLAAATTALLFGVHPLRVESVAWVTERKDVLSGLFFLLAMRAYLVGHAPGERPRRSLWMTALFFLLALASKPMAVSLPFALLILDLWPLGRLFGDARAALAEKAPLFLAMIGSAVVTLLAQSSALAKDDLVPASFRALNACRSLVLYLWQMAVPAGLVPFHPISKAAEPALSLDNLGPLALVTLAAASCVKWGTGRRVFFSAAALYYVITLAPVLGIVQVGGQASADRYTYLPSLAPFLLVSGGLVSLRGGLVVAALALSAFAGLSVRQIGTWRDSVTLWERVVAAYPDVSSVAHTNLAAAYREALRPGDAAREFRRAIAAGPPHAYQYAGLGGALLDLGQPDEAVVALEKAVAMDPALALAWEGLGHAYLAKGSRNEAREAFRASLARGGRVSAGTLRELGLQ